MSGFTFDGQITIEPALNFTQIKQARSDAYAMVLERYKGKPPRWMNISDPADPASFGMGEYLPLALHIRETRQEMDEGVMQIQRAVALIPSRSQDGALGYSMAEQVNRLIKLFPGHQFSGEVNAVEQEEFCATRLVIQDGLAKDIVGVPYIHFDDGTEVPVSDLL